MLLALQTSGLVKVEEQTPVTPTEVLAVDSLSKYRASKADIEKFNSFKPSSCTTSMKWKQLHTGDVNLEDKLNEESVYSIVSMSSANAFNELGYEFGSGGSVIVSGGTTYMTLAEFNSRFESAKKKYTGHLVLGFEKTSSISRELKLKLSVTDHLV